MSASGSSKIHVLYAVVSLLRELDEDGLRVVRLEAEQRLQALTKPMTGGGGG